MQQIVMALNKIDQELAAQDKSLKKINDNLEAISFTQNKELHEITLQLVENLPGISDALKNLTNNLTDVIERSNAGDSLRMTD